MGIQVDKLAEVVKQIELFIGEVFHITHNVAKSLKSRLPFLFVFH